MATINMEGFKAEEIELTIGQHKFIIPMDLPVEPYFEFMDLISQADPKNVPKDPDKKRIQIKDFTERARKFAIHLIMENNPGAEEEQLKKLFGVSNTNEFMTAFIQVQKEVGFLKNLMSPGKDKNVKAEIPGPKAKK